MSRQGASFEHPYDHILSDAFLIKKVGKLVETQKNCENRLNHSFSVRGSYFHFFDLMNIQKVSIFRFFFQFFQWDIIGDPLKRTEKNCASHALSTFKKLLAIMSLVFRENAKNRKNHRSFEVAVIGGKQF